ncbi:MAG: EAL domain-containing protein [Magnetococcales bacterium]|nr:EAL domain-containing protein [Magnetococcales bacterium]
MQPRRNIEQKLHNALERREFLLHYQPQFSMATGRVVGVEALVRWRSPRFGLVAPDQFVFQAEESGLILPLGAWVMQEACRQNRRWQLAGFAPIRVAVNLSPRQFLGDHLEPMVEQALADSGLDPQWLALEITENLLLSDQEQVHALLTRWHAKNLQITLDDCGTGYATPEDWLFCPIHTLKIDRSFMRDLAHNPESLTTILTLFTLARNLQLSVVAEGVTSEEQMRLLRELGCDSVQGFLLSPPVPAEDVSAFFDSDREMFSVTTDSGTDRSDPVWH